jgi:diadenosine tetraphosphatase ApaH/serine/threonine PP2A family protein phosphatase
VIADLERRGVDRVLQGGDLALGGWQPAEVVDRVRELGWPGVVGNTDELLWRPETLGEQIERAPKLEPLLRVIFEQHGPATSELLGEERLAWMRELPGELEDGELALVHAAPGDLWRAPMPDDRDADLLKAYAELDAEVVVYGHIHRPYVRDLGSMTVANSGSVGAPYDSDPRASYLLVDGSDAEVVRVAYDVEREVAGLLSSSYPGAERIAESRRRGQYMRIA